MLRSSKTFLSLFLAMVSLVAVSETASAAEQEAVDYRLTAWKKKHFHDAEKASDQATLLKKLGCEVEQDNHGGHIDVSYRCQNWRRMTLKSHSEAHRWEAWLKSVGFETNHVH